LIFTSTLAKVSGPWYYIADGLQTSHAYSPVPAWMHDAGNVISLAFMNPADIGRASDPVPAAFKNTTSYFQKLGKQVFFSIGGMAYAGNWNWLSNGGQAAAAGRACAQIARTYKVGIEIDYEGGADPVTGLENFVSGFRESCPIGSCVLSMDLYGSPGGQGWQVGVLKQILPPSGTPGSNYGNGKYLDFVNVMVIDGQTVDTAIGFWKQWVAAGLTMTRATFGLIAGWPGLGICSGDSQAQTSIKTAWQFLSSYSVYGVISWAVCPPAPGQQSTCGDWTSACNDNAPGFAFLCKTVGSC